MGKGSRQRPRRITITEWDRCWALAFNLCQVCGRGCTIGELQEFQDETGRRVQAHEACWKGAQNVARTTDS